MAENSDLKIGIYTAKELNELQEEGIQRDPPETHNNQTAESRTETLKSSDILHQKPWRPGGREMMIMH